MNCDQVLPVSNNDQARDAPVHIILNGKILLKMHVVDKPNEHKVMSVAKKGAIIGVKFLDQSLSCNPTVWSYVGSKSATLVKMNRATFDKIWKEMKDDFKEIEL